MDDEDFQELLSESENTEPIELYDSERLRKDVENDLALLEEFVEVSGQVKPEEDPKLEVLIEELLSIVNQAKNDSKTEQEEIDNRKVIIFSYFKDTAVWILERLEKVINQDDRFECYRGRFVATYGSPDRERVVDSKTASWGFAPRTAAPDLYAHEDIFDILISTGLIFELIFSFNIIFR